MLDTKEGYRKVAFFILQPGYQSQNETLIAKPPWEVSRYLAFISLPVAYMVAMTLSKDTQALLVRRSAMREALIALTAAIALRSIQGTCT